MYFLVQVYEVQVLQHAHFLGTNVRFESPKKSLQEDVPSWDSEGEAMPAFNSTARDGMREVSVEPFNVTLNCWYALRTRSRHEKLVRDRLSGLGMEPFLPLQKIKRQWSDRKVVTELPLFQGYCFARFALVHRMTILQTPGVVGIVGAVVPEAIPDAEVEGLRSLYASSHVMEPCDYFSEGMMAEVIAGPLCGVRGQVIRKATQDYIILRVHLIQQAVAVHIHADEIVPLS